MNNEVHLSHRPPEIDLRNLQKRKRFEAELFSLDTQIRNFAQLRDRLSATGKDGDAFYRKLLARRDQIAAGLKQVRTGVVSNFKNPQLLSNRLDSSFLDRPIAPASFASELGVFRFGTSGVVQAAPASEGVNVVAEGQYPTSGEIQTSGGAYPGDVTFFGVLDVGPEELNSQDQWDPTINYFWLHNWKYLIPFPPPTDTSLFTYRFDVYARFAVFSEALAATAMSFVSVGETANLTTGNDVAVDIDCGWPLMYDLTKPGPLYNGSYGVIEGWATVQRSFIVARDHVPGVAIVVGAVGALAMGSRVNFSFGGDSSIAFGSQNWTGRVAYSYEPQLAAHP
jgi:hypothetical protein